MTPLELGLLVLASHTVTLFVVYDDGPFGLMARFRRAAGASRESCADQHAANAIKNPLCCTRCAGLYVAAGLTLLWFAVSQVVIYALAAWGASDLLRKGVDRWL